MRYRQLLLARSSSPAFHPHGTQKILDLHPSVFAVERISPDEQSYMLCLHNVAAEKVTFKTEHIIPQHSGVDVTALFINQFSPTSTITLEPYQFLWMNL